MLIYTADFSLAKKIKVFVIVSIVLIDEVNVK